MFIVNCAAIGVCVLYGAYVFRVLRHAPYHDFKWLRRRTKTDPSTKGAASQRETHPAGSPMSRIEIISDADLFDGTRRLYRSEAKARLVACVEPSEVSLQPDQCPHDANRN